MGFPGGASGKEPACQCKRCKRPRFNPWVRKIPWRRVWQTIPVFYNPHVFLWLYAKYISYLVLTLTTPFPLKLHIGKKAAEPPNCQTQLLGYWHQFMTAFEEDNARGRNQDPITFVPHHWLLTVSNCEYKLLMEAGHSSWGLSLLCSPLHWLRIKAAFLFPPNSVSVFFIRLRRAEKAKILPGVTGWCQPARSLYLLGCLIHLLW